MDFYETGIFLERIFPRLSLILQNSKKLGQRLFTRFFRQKSYGLECRPTGRFFPKCRNLTGSYTFKYNSFPDFLERALKENYVKDFFWSSRICQIRFSDF